MKNMKYEKLRSDMIAAMKEKNKERKDSISALIDAIKKVAIDQGVRDNITDEIVDKVVLKELKSMKEQIDSCPSNREDLLTQYKNREAVFKEYAPVLLSKEEILKIVNEKYKDVIGSKNKGLIMKTIMPEFKGKADGKIINEIVEDFCK